MESDWRLTSRLPGKQMSFGTVEVKGERGTMKELGLEYLAGEYNIRQVAIV